MTLAKQVSWLHISDLHAGQPNSDWLWPNVKSRFFSDIGKVIPALGSLDLVIFSGDLTQSGSIADFKELRKILDSLWQEFQKFGYKPKLFLVPGNHDLARPDKYDPTANAMKAWWQNPDIRESFWQSPKSPYRTFISTLFKNYTDFLKQLRDDSFPLLETVDGAIPGDSSAVFEKEGLALGLVGLNSSYLHFFDTPEKDTLDLHPRQLVAVTNGDPQDWCSKNYVNFLVTHHPQDWLNPRAVNLFESEINPAGRFTAHFFGHMHEPRAGTASYGGGFDRRFVQAASLLGLRKFGTGELERLHGYSGGKVAASESSGELMFWPRMDSALLGGGRQFMADGRLGLTEQNNFIIKLSAGLSSGSEKPRVVEPQQLVFKAPADEARESSTEEIVSRIAYALKYGAPHLHVRKLEQHKLKKALDGSRCAWLSADWNSGTEEFISSVVSSGTSPANTYRFSLQDYSGRDDFFAKFAAEAGTSFQEFSKAIFDSKNTLLLLEDVPTHRTAEGHNWEEEIIDIVDAFQDYCPNSSVILVSRQKPASTKISIVEVLPLDEADVKTYLVNAPGGGLKFAESSSVSDIYKLTEGSPIEIDSLLKELKFISLQDYLDVRLTASGTAIAVQTNSEGTFSAVEALRTSTDQNVVRAYGLLRALSVFPYGETLKRIRRFNNQLPFHSEHAQILEERGVIDIIPISVALNQIYPVLDTSPKLHVKKPIREYVLAQLSPNEIYDLYKRAASVYFGDDWIHGAPKNLKANDVITALGGGGLGNPHAAINNLFQQASASGESSQFQKVVMLARLFVVDLERTDNFRSQASACRDFLKLLPASNEDHAKDRNWFLYKLGISLRMLGNSTEAISCLSEVKLETLDKSSKLRLLLNWALAEEKNKNFGEAKRIAKQVISLGSATFQAMEAESLLLQQSPEDPEQLAKLKALENRARRRKAFSVASNITYFLSRNGNWTAEEKRETFRSLAKAARQSGDPYDASRAVAEIGFLARKNLIELLPDEVSGMIDSYHYLYQERMPALFDACHHNLWDYFIKQNDISSLLRLFRHTSFIWRLNGEDAREKSCMADVHNLLSKNGIHAFEVNTIEAEYFLIRSEKVQTKPAAISLA